MIFSRKPSDALDATIITLPSNMLADIFGKVSYRKVTGGEVEVMFSIMLPNVGEGWRTGVALDGSESMRALYGRALTGSIPPAIVNNYKKKGWVREESRDGGAKYPIFQPEAYEDAIASGHLRWTSNEVQPKARDFLEYLATNLDSAGQTSVIYWACSDGSQIEEIGDIKASDCSKLEIIGPQKASFGGGTHLMPAVRYFEKKFRDTPQSLFVFITDGKLDDLDSVKAFCTTLAKQIESGSRNPTKFILIGLGPDIDESQMTELDDLDTGTNIDLWDHKIAADMRELSEILAELVDETQIVAPMAAIYDASGNPVLKLTDGLPARVIFRMPDKSMAFTLEVPGLPGETKFHQSILLPGKKSL